MMSTDTISPLLTTASPDSKRCSPTEDSQSTALQPPKHIWLLTGPAGCGKTTVAKYLQKQLALPFVEGDDVRWRNCVLIPCLGTVRTQ